MLTAVLAVVVVAGRHEVDVPWIRSLGIRWHFAVDGISAALVLLTALLTVAVVVHALAGRIPAGGSGSTFLGCILLVETGALATFLARDAILFFIAFEVVLVPMWVLIRSFGDDHVPDERRSDAAGRFVLFTVLGSTLMLVGILFLVHHQGTSDLTELGRLHGDGLSPLARDRHRRDPAARARHQGAALAAAHVAAARAHRRPDRRLGAARRRAAQDGHLRHRAARRRDRARTAWPR